MANIILVSIGIILFLYSLFIQGKLLNLVKGTSLKKWWVTFLVLVGVFTSGYIIFAYCLVIGIKGVNLSFIETLVSLIFFFGAIFVVMTTILIHRTTKDSVNEKGEIQRLQAEKINILQNKESELNIKITEKTAFLEKVKTSLEEEIKNKTLTLQEKTKQLEILTKTTVERELKMKELKKEIEELKRKMLIDD